MKIIKSRIFPGVLLTLLLLSCNNKETYHIDKNELRAPAYPLVTIDPYTSAWSFGDNLYDSSLKHWTGQDFPLIGVVKVDGVPYRFMGIEDEDPMVSMNGDASSLSAEGIVYLILRRRLVSSLSMYSRQERYISLLVVRFNWI